jgi:hypothetical protein
LIATVNHSLLDTELLLPNPVFIFIIEDGGNSISNKRPKN